MKGVRIDPSLMKAEEKEILEDLLVAAHADAQEEVGKRHAGKDEATDRRIAAAARSQSVWMRWRRATIICSSPIRTIRG